MNKLFINIIDEYWGYDEKDGIYIQGRRHRHSGEYATSENIEEFEKQLADLIMNHKNDGLEMESHSSSQIHFINVILLLGDKNNTEYDISYLIDFLENYRTEYNIPLSDDNHLTHYLYIKYVPEKYNDLLVELNLQNADIMLLNETRKRYERGASDYWVGYLIGVASTATFELVKYALGKFRKEHSYTIVEFTELDMPSLKKNISDLIGVNHYDLRLVSLEKGELYGEYKVTFKSRYGEYTVVSDTKGTIRKLSVEEKTTTRI